MLNALCRHNPAGRLLVRYEDRCKGVHVMKLIVAVLIPALLLMAGTVAAQETTQDLPTGALTEQALGEVLNAIGLKPVRTDKRYDFAFKTSIRGEEWKFSMSSVLSRNGESIWVMAWLDQIPSQSSQVPRTSLLRLLAANDRLGNGKFFAYIPTNKRFVLQRVMKNENMSTRKLMESLQDLAVSVADEYPTWSVANWAAESEQSTVAGSPQETRVPLPPPAANRSARTHTSEAQSKFNGRTVQ
ncbi:MAG: hypothetical protein R3C59_24140 [Planctomycetaceae bacterium]